MPIVLATSFLVFLLVHAVPGDPAQAWLGFETTDPAQLEQVRRQLGLDRPLLVQYATWIAGVVQGDLGTSTRTGRGVAGLVLKALPVTIELAAYALILIVLLGVPLGIWGFLWSSGSRGALYRALVLLGLSVPQFWLGAMLILLFGVRLGWLQLLGIPSLAEDPLANLAGMLLLALTLAGPSIAQVARMTHSSLHQVAREEFVRVARAKGVRAALALPGQDGQRRPGLHRDLPLGDGLPRPRHHNPGPRLQPAERLPPGTVGSAALRR